MPAERVPMRQVCEILRLTFSGDVAGREVARRLGIAPSTVRAAVERFRSSGLCGCAIQDGSWTAFVRLVIARGDGNRRA